MYAARWGHHECLSVLLAHGAEVDKANWVSIRGVCSIAYFWDVACIVVAAEGMHCNLHAANDRMAAQLSWMLLDLDTVNACQFCWLMVPKSIKPMQ